MPQFVVCGLYKFVLLDNYRDLRRPLLKVMEEHQINGTLLLAREGINGTIAGARPSVDILLDHLRRDPRLKDIEHKESLSDYSPFKRPKVKLKKEIVTMGVKEIDPKDQEESYVRAEDWNDLVLDPDVLLLDVRNTYEIKVGTFKGAQNPHIKNFRHFPQYVQKNLDPKKHKKIAMFCTGGIRCEKSTALLKKQGFKNVYQLKGGILKYLEKISPVNTLRDGECFVFDERVTVNHELQKGIYEMCHACRMPITEIDKSSDHYQKGVSCPYCYDKTSSEDKARFREREKQIALKKSTS